jgi:hypothetical protein
MPSQGNEIIYQSAPAVACPDEFRANPRWVIGNPSMPYARGSAMDRVQVRQAAEPVRGMPSEKD